MQAWYDEVSQFNFSIAALQSGTGHFTQVVWKAAIAPWRQASLGSWTGRGGGRLSGPRKMGHNSGWGQNLDLYTLSQKAKWIFNL